MRDSQIETAVNRVLDRIDALGATVGYLALYPKPLVAVETTGDDSESVMEEIELLGRFIAGMAFDIPQSDLHQPKENRLRTPVY